MNCFLMILNDKFNIEYLSNNISCYFLMKENQSIYELIHSSDHQILKDYFSNEHQCLFIHLSLLLYLYLNLLI